jgi:Carbohydrate-selective porin, OprB family/S-layer homology domain
MIVTLKEINKMGRLMGLGLSATLVGLSGATALPSTAQPSLAQSIPDSSDPLAQVPSVSKLSDVQPTDWAFSALQNLVEKYGCIAGYPDSTFRGNRSLTRYEFAAGLSACLDSMNNMIAASTADLVTRDDLEIFRRLQEEFAAELIPIRGRVDTLESHTSELEANQFSTTTKLEGEVVLVTGVPISQDRQLFQDQAIAGYETTLSFNTSFTGDDLLQTDLFANQLQNFASFGGTVEWNSASDDDATNAISLDRLSYTYLLNDKITVTVAAAGGSDSDWVTSSISPFDDETSTSSLSSFGTPAQYAYIPGGTGLGVNIQLTDQLSFDAAYATPNAFRSTPGAGLFNGDYGIVTQLSYLSDRLDAALTYANGYAHAGFINDEQPEVANTYGAQFNFKVSDGLQIGGGIAYVPIQAIGKGNYDVWSYQGTIALPDFGGDGNMLGVLFGVPSRATGVGNGLFPITDYRNQDAAFLVEGFYNMQLTDNVAITPGLIWLNSPGNDNGTRDTLVGAVRTTFSF